MVASPTTGNRSGLVVSRWSARYLHGSVTFGGLAKSAPVVRAVMSAMPENAAPDPKAPRLSPKTAFRGR